MKILIAAKHPPKGKIPIGGVQTWSTTVGNELVRLGHTVSYWGPEWSLPSGNFDLGILANLKYTFPAEKICTKTIKVAHGIIPDEEGSPEHLATSEEVQDMWGCKAVIRQPLDLDFWVPADSNRTVLTRHSYRKGLNGLPNISKELGLKFVHLKKESPEQVRDTLQKSVVVVATGRAAIEAMACGASVVIADDRPYQGPLLDLDPVDSMTRNYSGRGGVTATTERLGEAIKNACSSLRRHTEQHHDVRKIVKELLSYA